MTEPTAVKVRPGFATGLVPDDWGLLFACFAFSQAIGLITYWTLPLYAGALMTGLSLSATDVGLLGTIEFAGLLLTSSVLAPFIDRGFRREAAWISAVTVIAVNLVCGLLPLDLRALSVLRFVAGLASGVALTIGNASIANGSNPEKLSGQLTFLLVVFMMVAMPAFAWVSERFGYQGVFLALAATVGIGMLSAPFVPRRPNEDLGTAAGVGDGAGRNPLLTLAGTMLMLVAFLCGLRDTLPWLVTEQIATEAGLSIQQLGTLLAVMYGISAIGPVAQILLARKLSPRTLLAASMVGAGAFLWSFTLADGSAVRFGVGIVIWATIYFMAYAQLYAVAALVDRRGRLASALGGAFIGGVMVAPFIGGYLTDLGGFGALGWTEIGLTVAMIVAVLAGVPGLLRGAGAGNAE